MVINCLCLSTKNIKVSGLIALHLPIQIGCSDSVSVILPTLCVNHSLHHYSLYLSAVMKIHTPSGAAWWEFPHSWKEDKKTSFVRKRESERLPPSPATDGNKNTDLIFTDA